MERITIRLHAPVATSLNPCFNGIQMERGDHPHSRHGHNRLNPCFNGIQMERGEIVAVWKLWQSLNPCFNGIQMEPIKRKR